MRKNILLILLFFTLAAVVTFKGKEYLIPLDEKLVSPHDDVRNMAHIKLNKMKDDSKLKLVDDLLRHSQDSNPEVRRFAFYALRKIGTPNEDVKKAIIEALKDSSDVVREEAIASFLQLGASAVPNLLVEFRSIHPDAQKKLVEALSREPEDVVPQLMTTLDHSNPTVRADSALILWKSGEKAKPAEEKLLSHLNDTDGETRLYVALAESKIDSDRAQIVPALEEGIKGLNWTEPNFSAAEALGKIGPKAKAAIPALSKAYQTGNDGFGPGPYVKPTVALALGKIQPRKTDYKGLEWDLKNKSPLVRYRAALYLDLVQKPETIYIPMLVGRMSDPDVFVFARATSALSKQDISKAARFHDVINSKVKVKTEMLKTDERIKDFGPVGTALLAKVNK